MHRIETIFALIERFVLRRESIKTKPFWFVVETSGACNLRCPKCPQSDKSRINSGLMKLDHFKIILEKISDSAKVISFNNWGDPFFNKDIFEMIAMARDAGIKTNCSSNLTYLSNETLDSIVSSGLSTLTASIDGATKETYSKYRVGGDFERAISAVHRIQWKKFHALSKTPDITWQFIVNRFNERDIDLARTWAKTLGVRFSAIPLRPKTWMEPLMTDEEKLADLEDWLPIIRKDISYERLLKSGKFRDCYLPWTSMVINWNGEVYPCCSIYGEHFVFGNILEQSLEEIWNGPMYQLSRSALLKPINSKNRFLCSLCKQHNGICK